MFLLRLALGNTKLLVNEVFTTSLIVALISGAKALTNVVLESSDIGLVRPWTYLITTVYSELKLVTSLWSIPMWSLVLVATYLMSNYVIQDLRTTFSTLKYLGSPVNQLVKLIMTRYLITSSMTCITGLSTGVVVAQIVFRFVAYIVKTPYEVPNLYLSDLIEVVVITYVTTFLGVVKPLLKIVRCGYVP
jgi:hypothetical protein